VDRICNEKRIPKMPVNDLTLYVNYAVDVNTFARPRLMLGPGAQHHNDSPRYILGAHSLISQAL